MQSPMMKSGTHFLTQGRYDPYVRSPRSDSPAHFHPYDLPRSGTMLSPSFAPVYKPGSIHNPTLSMKSAKLHLNPAASADRKIKAPESPQASGRYQPSRGAQRDAKQLQKHAEKAKIAARSRSPSRGQSMTSREFAQCGHPTHRATQRSPFEFDRTQQQYQTPHFQPPLVERSLCPSLGPVRGPAGNAPADNWARIRKEQQAAIAAARQMHAADLQGAAVKDEQERKVRRIQLQVFVHARPTHCAWSGCHAVLNFWALLEKHIHHAHLHPDKLAQLGQNQSVPIACQWTDCSESFGNREACYHHVLTDHMTQFAARCPFNCLFEGPEFPNLMAHINRRHPSATPDDFVPGLIHHRPTFVPTYGDLPPLPTMSKPLALHWLDREVKPYSGEVGQRIRKSVQRNCCKGRYPRQECYETKRGASAAIAAIIENSRRLSDVKASKGGLPAELDIPETAKTSVDLVDVVKSAKLASDEAKQEVSSDEDLTVLLPEEEGSIADSYSGASRVTTPRIKLKSISLVVKRSKHDRSEFSPSSMRMAMDTSRSSTVSLSLSNSEDESMVDLSSHSTLMSQSDGSLYAKHTSQQGSGPCCALGSPVSENGIKRSARLKKKARRY